MCVCVCVCLHFDRRGWCSFGQYEPTDFVGIDGDESSVAKVEPVALDAADAHAIEEVNLAYENVKDVDVLDTAKEGTDLWEAAVKRYEERIDR